MSSTFPNKLKPGDEVRIIAPSRSLKVVSEDNQALATKALESLHVKLTFGKHVNECDLMLSSSINARVQDLHEAFADQNVKAVLTVLGGYNSNQLLDSLDYELIKNNPKIFCGFSDITALSNAIYHKTGLVTYSGVHYSSFGMRLGFEYSYDYFKKIMFEADSISLQPSKQWADDAWFLDQVNRTFHKNTGYSIIQPGKAEGKIIGGNLGTLQLLRGTPYMPSLDDSILFLEEVNNGAAVYEFDRNLQSLTQAPEFHKVKAIVIGRFENEFGMTDEKLRYILSTKSALNHIPIIANADFGHTTPIFTFPIGGRASLLAESSGHVQLVIEKH
jgi:muramoyltetrapeptide carboxypeptidase LdcA involved in peptidoglycan recycling